MMRKIKKVLAAILGVSMLFGSISVMAAARPDKVTNNPTWGDLWTLQEYVGEQVYERVERGEMDFYSEAVKGDDSKRNKPGMLLASADKEQAYAAIIDAQNWEVPGADWNVQLTDNWPSVYSDLYDAGIAFVNSIITASGEYYKDDLWPVWETLSEQDRMFWKKIEQGKIILVANGGNPPEGTDVEWVYESAVEAYAVASQAIWDSDIWDKEELTRNDLQTVIDRLRSALQTLAAGGKFDFSFLQTPQTLQALQVPAQPTENESNISYFGSHIHHFVDVVIQEATVNQDGQTVRQCSICGAVEPGSRVKVSGYNVFIKDTIASIEKASGKELTINTDRWVSFNEKVFDVLEKKSELALTINYVYNHKKYRVTIPAGADLNGLCNEEGFCGFRYLDLVFGGRENTEE